MSEFERQKVARILDQAAVQAFNKAADEIVPLFDSVEEICLSEVSSEELRLEIKRRAAEWKLKLCCDRDVSTDAAETLRNEVLNLGFSNLENEATLEIYFAQYCLRNDLHDAARKVLESLSSKLEKALQSSDMEVFRHFEEVTIELLAQTSG